MSAPDPSPEQRELTLVGKVEMRIALANSDAKLSTILGTYLPPLLLKLASEHHSVRNKVITICQHINTRVQPDSVQLPVKGLIKQFQQQENSLIRHFDLLYIQQGVTRLPASEKADLLPVILQGIARSGNHGPQIFYLLLRLLETFTLPPRGDKGDLELRKNLNVSDEDVKFVATHIGKFILFTPRGGTNTICPGLHPDDYKFFMVKEDAWNSSAGGLNLLRTKTLAVRLLASGLFHDSERFLPALFASADPASPISDVGDDILKRALPVTDLEDENLVQEMFDLYFGGRQAPPVKVPVRLKLLNLLNKSVRSTSFAASITQLVQDGVSPPQQDGEDTVMAGAPTQNTSIGREATKLRAAIFSYINFVARQGDRDTLHAIAAQTVKRLQDFIENQGWPKPGVSEDLVSRGYAYEVIGLLAKAGPKSVLVENEHATMDLLRWLFESLARDTSGSSITVSIEEALSTCLTALSQLQLNDSEQSLLEELLISQMTQSADLEANSRIRSTRYVAVRYANRCLPYRSTKARWINVLAQGAVADRPEVREEGERGLSPYWYRMLNGLNAGDSRDLSFPSFADVVDLFFRAQTGITSSDPATLAHRSQELHSSSFRHMTTFAQRMLTQEAVQAAGIAANIDGDWERRIDALMESDVPARNAVKRHIKELAATASQPFNILICALLECVKSKTAFEENHLTELLGLSPEPVVASHTNSISALIEVLRSNNNGRRMTAALAFGILASHPSANPTAEITKLLRLVQGWSTAVGASLSSVHGAIVALGFYFSRIACRRGQSPTPDEYRGFSKALFEIFSDSRDDLLREGTHIAIGQMCMFGCLDTDAVSNYTEVSALTDKLYEKSKDGNESAIICLGRLSMILPEASEEIQHIEEQLHKLHEIKQSEVHFTVGEAFSCLAAGWQSGALTTKLDVETSALPPSRTQTLPKVVDRILKDCANTKPALKKAAVMWLLCLVQYCGDQLQNRLSECQTAFRRCLSDRDELVQESASRGLGLVYEKGDRSLKDDLVRELVSSFSSDKQQLAGNVSADTQLFEPGALPTGDGSVSTYKDIMSLAAEVGDSSLVYKFMSMASSNAIWSSRAAFGRFGLSRVLSDSSVDGYLANNPKLYPKLFRYRFDPNSGVQRSMNDIWTALVPDSAATIDKHFDAIMEDLLTSILGKEWRVRQACCAAIADLVQARPLDKYEQYLERIWTQCFKVLDDIKESVRAAAASLARSLTGVLTRALEADHSSTKNASVMLKHVLPFILSPSGMESSAKEVQAFSVVTLLEIIKKANGSTIRPFIPELVERLIGLLSALENEAVNYLHLNAKQYNLTEQKIDDMRLSSVRGSPLMESIERCLDLVDDETMPTLWSKLEGAMKSAVGLPSKVGSSRVLVSLATRRMVLFRPYSDNALKLIEKLIIDRNDTVSSSYAVAAGYLTRGASDKQVVRMIEFAKKLYFESEGDREGTTPRRSITAGEIMYAFAKHASDRFNSFATAALPFVFVAKHDSNDQVREQFQDTWNEAVGGSRAVQLYLNEILEICLKHLDSPQWTLKHTAARAVSDTVMAVSSSEADMSAATGNALWPAIDKALGGKTWDGKEVVLSAFVKFVEIAKPYYKEHENVRAAIVKIALREAKRQNASYRPHAVKALGKVAQARTDIDLSEPVFAIIEPLLLLDEPDDDAMDVDRDNDQVRKAEELKEVTQSGAIECLFASINPLVSVGKPLSQQISRDLTAVAAVKPATAALLRSTYDGVSGALERVRREGREMELGSEGMQSLKALLFGPVIAIEAIRLTRAEAVVAAAKSSRSIATGMEEEVRGLIANEVSSLVRDRLAASLAVSP